MFHGLCSLPFVLLIVLLCIALSVVSVFLLCRFCHLFVGVSRMVLVMLYVFSRLLVFFFFYFVLCFCSVLLVVRLFLLVFLRRLLLLLLPVSFVASSSLFVALEFSLRPSS